MTRLKPDLRLLGMLLVAVTIVGVGTRPALAVDVINGDAAAREIVVNDDDGESKIVTLAPHQKMTGICQSCIVLLGKESAEAHQSDVVKISDGKVLVRASERQ
jgi:hypothetical protein